MDIPHLREAPHRLAVLAHGGPHDPASHCIAEAQVPSGDREAGGEPLHVPLERSRQRLVEVVETEDEPPIRCGVDAEVREVRVSAELRVQSRPRPVGEVGCHEIRPAAEEGERGGQHAPVPNGAELGKTRLSLLLEKIDRVSADLRRLPRAVRRASELGASGPSPRSALGRRHVRRACPWRGSFGRRVALVRDARRGRSRTRRRIRVQLMDLCVCVLHRSARYTPEERRSTA